MALNPYSIKKITLFPFDIRLTQPFVISLETITHAHNTLVHLECEDPELDGWGEASPYQTIQGENQSTQLIIGKLLAQALIGQDARDLPQCIQSLQATIAFNRCIKSAFDMALYDVQAKIKNLPLYEYLGGSSRMLKTDMTIGIGSPAEMAQSATYLVNQGFTEIKIKLGKDVKEDIHRVELIRQAIGPAIKLRIDANQGWSVDQATQVLHAIQKFDIEHCEQPVSARNINALKQIRDLSPIPIMADEALFDSNDASILIALQACSQFNIKLGKSGGIHEAIAILDLAKTHHIACQVGCFSESRLGITALTHLALAFEEVIYYDMDSSLMLSEDPVVGGAEFKNTNEIYVSSNPGLGLTVDPIFLKTLKKIEIQ